MTPRSLVLKALTPALGLALVLASCDAESPPEPATPPAGDAPADPAVSATGPVSSEAPAEPAPAAAAEAEPVAPASPGKVKVVQVLVPWKGAAGAASSVSRTKAEARARAEQALAEARSGTAIAEVVRKYGEGPLAKKGGVLGEFRPGDLEEPYASAVFGLAPGGASELLESPMGWQVLYRLP